MTKYEHTLGWVIDDVKPHTSIKETKFKFQSGEEFLPGRTPLPSYSILTLRDIEQLGWRICGITPQGSIFCREIEE